MNVSVYAPKIASTSTAVAFRLFTTTCGVRIVWRGAPINMGVTRSACIAMMSTGSHLSQCVVPAHNFFMEKCHQIWILQALEFNPNLDLYPGLASGAYRLNSYNTHDWYWADRSPVDYPIPFLIWYYCCEPNGGNSSFLM